MDGTLPSSKAGPQRSLEHWFRRWLADAPAGDRFTYFIGFLALGIGAEGQWLPEAERKTSLRTAQMAWIAAERGRVHLLQRRLGENRFEYFAVARPPRPKPPPDECWRLR